MRHYNFYYIKRFLNGTLKLSSPPHPSHSPPGSAVLTCFVLVILFFLDGNTKDSIKITDNLKFDYDDNSEVMDLQTFKKLLLKALMKKAYFQNEPKLEVNMLKLPLIIAPSLLGKQVNNDNEKMSLLDKTVNYKPEIFEKFIEMVDDGKIDILGIDKMGKKATLSIAKGIGLEVTDKTSLVVLKNEIKNMALHVLAGQGACHGYKRKRGRTGGFTDVYCDHKFKIGSKVQPKQESVRYF